MHYKRSTRIAFGFLLAFGLSSATATAECKVPVTELQSGVWEVDLGNTKVKLEQYNKIVKMKIVSSLNEDWNSVTVTDEVSQITGYLGNGEAAQLTAQLYVRLVDDGFEWAVFRKDPGASEQGTAFFYFSGQHHCTSIEHAKWQRSAERVIGQPRESSVINLSNDSLLS